MQCNATYRAITILFSNICTIARSNLVCFFVVQLREGRKLAWFHDISSHSKNMQAAAFEKESLSLERESAHSFLSSFLFSSAIIIVVEVVAASQPPPKSTELRLHMHEEWDRPHSPSWIIDVGRNARCLFPRVSRSQPHKFVQTPAPRGSKNESQEPFSSPRALSLTHNKPMGLWNLFSCCFEHPLIELQLLEAQQPEQVNKTTSSTNDSWFCSTLFPILRLNQCSCVNWIKKWKLEVFCQVPNQEACFVDRGK